jgi:hypothetical protein
MRAVFSVLALAAAFTAGMRYAQTCPTPEPYDPPLLPTHVPTAPIMQSLLVAHLCCLKPLLLV